MQKKEQIKVNLDKGNIEVVEAKPIYMGIATCNLIVDNGSLEKGDKVAILADNGSNEWLTEKGLVSKLFLLLKNI
jgi:hypothetical protein